MMAWKWSVPTDPSLLIAQVLTEGERLAFLDRFTGFNPHWNGAQVADVLAALDDMDAHCGDIEGVVSHFQPVPEECVLYRMASYAVLYSAPSPKPRLLAEAVLGQIRDLVAKVRD